MSTNNDLLAQLARQVERLPDTTALMTPDSVVSYRELQQKSDHIAGVLHERGVTKDSIVGLCIPRGIDAVCAMLGILKAGAAYLPIDPAYPSQLQRRMAQTAELRFLLIDQATENTTLAESVEHAYTITELYEAPLTKKLPLAAVPGERLFHVLYTSGSTDEPKGVCGSYAQLQARLQWLWQAFPLSGVDVCCQKTALHFVDASLEIFGALLQGLPLLIAPDSYSSNPERLLNLLVDHKVTRISLVVSQLRALLIAYPDCGQPLTHLNLCIVSGERLTSDLVDTFRQALPHVRLVNLYGCSEVPEISYFEIQADTELAFADAPIGYAIDGTEVHIVDDELQEVRTGDKGELWVGSSLQATGYLNRPAETTARFIDNPFGNTERLYRTGDLVRKTSNGLLVFEGRADDQVKIRGYRIELSAVEAALKSCDIPLDALKVVVQQDPLLAENRSLVAFVTPASVDTKALQYMLRQRAPHYLQVQRIIALEKMPSTASGKIDRRLLTEIAQAGFAASDASADDMPNKIAQLWKSVLLTDNVGSKENFFEIGGDSLRLAQLHERLQQSFANYDLSLAELFEYPTIYSQINYLQQSTKASAAVDTATIDAQDRSQDIAVIGMACRFPGADSPEEFWVNLRHGIDSVTDFTDDELEQADAQLRNDPYYVKSGSVLADIAGFDAGFFGFTDKEAAMLDPQQRLLLECAWEGLERAGMTTANGSSQIGVYAGSSASSYFINNVASNRPVTEATLTEYQENLANDRNFLATRIAYRLQLTGPAINVQTACSTGLVVIHMACQALRDGECEVALAGSVAVKTPQKTGYLFEDGMIRSPDGRCRAFDEQAEGTLFGNGAGLVVLKPLAAAQADGDSILAVIKGSAVNNDGAVKVGYTAPSVSGQADVVEAAMRAAAVDPLSIGYVEAHGTGTRLGDPIEISALTRAYKRMGWTVDEAAQYCAIGSVKSNIGHLDEAAGMAGFIKAVLALQHKEIPPTLHFYKPNPEIDFANSPFHVNAQLKSWPANSESKLSRCAGVSSFGMGGTNCHLVLEEALTTELTNSVADAGIAPSHQLLVLSSASQSGLSDLTQRYSDWLATKPNLDLADVCATAAVGRTHLSHRCTAVASSVTELQEQLDRLKAKSFNSIVDGNGSSKVAFLFTGQGAQYIDMARQLYETCAPFRATFDRCAAILDQLLPEPLLSVMFSAETEMSSDGALLSQTQYTQPALFTIEYALAELWQSWGISPDLLIGHSVGEYVAACVAGVFELEDALPIVAERGRLIQALPAGGGMLAIAQDEAATEELLTDYADVCIAAINSPTSTVISGDLEQLDSIVEQLQSLGVRHTKLSVSHAFHSASLEPMLEPFINAFGKLQLNQPQIPVISNVTGELVSAELCDPEYWIKHTRSAVRFADGITTLHQQDCTIVLEIGPSPTLLSMVAEIAESQDCDTDSSLLLPSLRKGQDDWAQLFGSLGCLYEQGCEIDWSGVYQDMHWRKVELPTMPFQRKRCWIENEASNSVLDDANSVADTLDLAAKQLHARGLLTAEQLDIIPLLAAEIQKQSNDAQASEKWSDLLYELTWQRMPLTTNPDPANMAACWVILADQSGIGAALAAEAEAAGITVYLLFAGDEFTSLTQNRWTINPARTDEFTDFWHQHITTSSQPVARLIYLWGLDTAVTSPKQMSATGMMQAQQTILSGVLGLLPLLTESNEHGTRLWCVTCGSQSINSIDAEDEPGFSNPSQATLWGLGRSLALEHPQMWGGLIDLEATEDVMASAYALWNEMQQALPQSGHDEQIVLRNSNRYVARLKPAEKSSTSSTQRVNSTASYFITGGLGALGLECAEVLVELGARHLILLSRSGVTTKQQSQRLEALRHKGVNIQTPQRDVADETAMRALFVDLNTQEIPLKGIIHAAGTIAAEADSLPDWSRFEAVLPAKVAGSWNLHLLSRHLELDFFVLFSSASSLLGLSGHAEYAAANAYLDALAGYRQQHHLPVLSISWGDWAGSGMAADSATQDTMSSTGLGALSPSQAKTALRELLGESGHLAVIRADWPHFITGFQAHQRFLSSCVEQEKTSSETTATIEAAIDIQTKLRDAAEPELTQLLSEHLAVMVGKVLGRDAASLDPDCNLLSLGFDSLMLIELRNQLRRELGLQLSLPRMLQGPAINELVIEASALFAKPDGDIEDVDTELTNIASNDDESSGEGPWQTIII